MARFLQDEFDFGIGLQLFFHLLDTAAAGLDELHVLENRGQDPVADLASAGAQLLEGEGVREGNVSSKTIYEKAIDTFQP